MDSKKTYKKISTIFWLFLATLPLWCCLIGFIGQYIGGVPESFQGIAQYNNPTKSYYEPFSYYFETIMQDFTDCFPWIFRQPFMDFFDLMDVDVLYPMAYLLGWFFFVYSMEVVIDLFCWLPKFAHKILEKGES